MERYGNIRFNRRMVVTLCLLVMAVSFLMPLSTVFADSSSGSASRTFYNFMGKQNFSASELYFINVNFNQSDGGAMNLILVCSSDVIVTQYDYGDNSHLYNYTFTFKSGGSSYVGYCFTSTGNFADYKAGKAYYSVYENGSLALPNYDLTCDKGQRFQSKLEEIFPKIKSGEFQPNCNVFYKPQNYDRSLGFLAGVELQQINDKSKDKKGSPDGSGLMETIIYNDKTTTGVDLKNGDYKIEVAWADAYLNAKSTAYYAEDKKKTSICKFDAKLNCKSADSLKRYYYNVLDANKKCKDNSTEGFEPNMFTIITKHLKSQPTYWYRIITKDNKYSGWVKIGIKGGEVDDISFPQDTYDNEDNKVDADHGGYHKDNSKEAIGSGDSKDEAIEDSVADSQRKDDNNVINNGSSKDLWNSLKEFVKGVESVPIMIADLFSFLPSWCLGLVASGFALMITLMIINCIKS